LLFTYSDTAQETSCANKGLRYQDIMSTHSSTQKEKD